MSRKRARRGGVMLWALAGLALAVAMAPLYVGACRSLSRLTGRQAHRLVATQRGTAELERLRAGAPAARSFPVSELPSGRGEVTVAPGPAGLKQVTVRLTWDENGTHAHSDWITLVRGAGGAR